MRPIIETVIFCGKQEIALRGHRDHGNLNLNEENEENEGNFRALLRFRTQAGDKVLASHLSTMAANSTYISWRTQNSIINSCSSLIVDEICQEVSAAKFYTVIADETTDCSTKSQFSICLRYYDIRKHILKERFLAFVQVCETTGANLSREILTTLAQCRINLADMRGQSYDGCSAMSGSFSGVQAIIRENNDKAIYVHCVSHKLNLALTHSTNDPMIRNAICSIKEVGNFFGQSSKRTTLLADSCKAVFPDSKIHRLKTLCTTRWVESHAVAVRFSELYPAILVALDEASTKGDRRTTANAASLKATISTSGFIVAVVVLESVSALVLPLAKMLQQKNVDLQLALALVDEVKNELQHRRSDIENEWDRLYQKALEKAEQAQVIISAPRLFGRQAFRANVAATTPKEYYLRNSFIPYLDFIIGELNGRFNDGKAIVMPLQALVPFYTAKACFQDLQPALNFYSSDLADPTQSVVESEFNRWKRRWLTESERTKSAAEALSLCDSTFYPNIKILLRIFVTLPVTTASAERSFSTLRRLKNYLRSTMSSDRLCGLAHLTINRDISSKLKIDDIIDHLANDCKRRLDFLI